jgi:hypothetical protein
MSGAMAPEAETIIRQTETINRLMGDSASRIERVQRQLDSAYAAQQRYEQAQTAITAAVERGRITQERANQLLQLAQQRYQTTGQAAQQFAVANDNAARSNRNFGGVIGQAGFQIQDFAVQVQSGTSALTALSQQGSQLLGAFGTAGAIAGAVLTVGLLATQLLTGGDAAKLFNDALDKTRTIYDALNDAAERRGQGQEREIERVERLRAYYASLSEEQRRGAEAASRSAELALQLQAQRQLDTATTRIRPLLASGQSDDFGLARTPDELRRVEAALQSIDLTSGQAQQQLLGLIGSLNDLSGSSSRYAPAASTARDAAIALIEQFGRLDAVARSAGRGIDEVALAQRALQTQIAQANVGQELTAQLFQAQQQAARFARGDIAGARAATREQEIEQRRAALIQQATDAARRSFPEGTDRGVIDRAIADRRDQIEREATRLANLDRQNRESEERARQAERDAARNARRGEVDARREDRLTERARRERDQLIASLDEEAAANIRLEESLRRIDEARRRNLLSEQEAASLSQRARDRREQDIVRANDKSQLYAEDTKRLAQLNRELSDIMGQAFSDLVREGKSFEDTLKNIERQLLRLGDKYLLQPLLDQLAQLALSGLGGGAGGGMGGAGGILGGLTSLIGGGATAEVAGAGIAKGIGAAAMAFHTGGVVGRDGAPRVVPAEVFLDAPRYHSGGMAGGMKFASDEVPAVLRRGEMVLTEQQQKAVANRGSINQTVIVQTADPGAFNRTRDQVAREMRRDLARAARSA